MPATRNPSVHATGVTDYIFSRFCLAQEFYGRDAVDNYAQKLQKLFGI